MLGLCVHLRRAGCPELCAFTGWGLVRCWLLERRRENKSLSKNKLLCTAAAEEIAASHATTTWISRGTTLGAWPRWRELLRVGGKNYFGDFGRAGGEQRG